MYKYTHFHGQRGYHIYIYMAIYIYISSDGADHVSLKLGPKSGTYQPAIDVCANMSCKLVWRNQQLLWIIRLAFWAMFAPLSILAVSSVPACTWFVSATHSVGVLTLCCLLSISLFHVRMPCVPSTGLQKYVPPRRAFHIAVLRRSLLTYSLCALTVVYPVKTIVQTKRPIYADVKGGAPPEVGSKQWLDSIMEGLASRHLKPPMRQVHFLAQDDSTVARLQKATSIKQQLDIVCGAAFKAKLGWQKVPGNMVPAESARVDVAPTPAVQTWRLRPRDWKVCKPASTDELPITGDRADAFRKDASGDPLNHLWTRHAGAYFLSAAQAATIFGPFPRTNLLRDCSRWLLWNPLEDLNPQLLKLLSFIQTIPHTWSRFFFRILALRKLSQGTWTTVSLASVDSVEVLLEWHKDLSEGDDLDSFRDFAKRASSNATARVGTKGQGKGKGKAKHDKSANGGIKF